jgi:membrane associated rhomboid family serine protease
MTPWVLRLIVANVAMYFMQGLAVEVAERMVLVPVLFPREPWTLVTYMFLHGSGTHLLFNMISLFFFGPQVEARLGSRHFLGLYAVSGIVGGLLSILFTPRVPGVIGASGAIFGVTLAFARYWPRSQIYIWGILPVEARWLVVIMTALSLFGARTGGDGIAHFAHLGGFLGGYLYLRWCELRSPARSFRNKAAAPPVKRTSGSGAIADLQRWSRIPRDSMHEVNRTEINRILDKINATGIASLTPGERETLERFSPKT